MRPNVLRLGAFAIALIAGATSARAQLDVVTNRYNNNRTGSNLTETALNQSNVNSSSFGKIGEYNVTGAIYAQPLYVNALATGAAGTHDVLYVATMSDVLYAFDADQVAPPLWSLDLSTVGGAAGPQAIQGNPQVGAAFGIMGTPVIDRPNNRMFVVTDTVHGGNPAFTIFSIDIRTGQILASQAINSAISPVALCQRAALSLVNGQVYVAFASLAPGDYIFPYHGYIMTFDQNTLANTGTIQTTNTINGGTIWQSGGGPAFDAAGNAYVLTANGFGNYDGVNNFQDSLLQLSYSGALKLSNWFTASNWQAIDQGDQDLSASAPLTIPGTNVVVFGSKLATVYVANTGNLGQLTPNDTQLLQKFQVGTVGSTGDDNDNRLTSMVLWPRSASSQLYAWPADDKLYSYTFNGTTFTQNGVGTMVGQQQPGPAYSLSANGQTPGTAILWATSTLGPSNNDSVSQPGILYAINGENVSQVLWNSSGDPRDSMIAIAKYVPPVVANGRVYVAGSTGSVSVYGLRTTPVGWTGCGAENGTCTVTGSNTVRYGSGSSWFYQSVIGLVACNNGVFGDPLYGTVKQCQYKPETWTTCSAENQTCALNGSNTVRYGQNSTYTSRSFVNSTACNNGVFGDPLYGTFKQCQSKPELWSSCAQEGGVCTTTGPQTVRFGSNASYVTMSVTANVGCTNAAFGSDPAPGFIKVCEILTH